MNKKKRRGGPLGPHRDRGSGMPKGLAKRIINARLRRGLSQVAAAADLGVSRTTWALWELGREPAPLYRKALDSWLRRKGGK